MKKQISDSTDPGKTSVFSGSNGILCLTFDDRYFNSWVKAIELFKKYDAHATFFVYGNIDEKNIAELRQLQNAGHSIGLHSLTHIRAADYTASHDVAEYIRNEIAPQLEMCQKNDLKIRAFAYPYSQRTSVTDQELFKHFDFLRSSWLNVKKENVPLTETDECFVKQVSKKQLFYGFPACGDFDLNEIQEAMKHAAEEDAVLVFYAHDITENINPGNHVAFTQLAQILEYARTLNMTVCGMDQL